jgi:hypothetical protein
MDDHYSNVKWGIAEVDDEREQLAGLMSSNTIENWILSPGHGQ